MAVPPCYADLGKSAKDIFNKGYGMASKYVHITLVSHCGLRVGF